MREILFRGKRVGTGEWVEGWFVGKSRKAPYNHPREKPQIIDQDLYCYEVKPETIGQYTELTDANGKKIFEGDIIKHTELGYKHEVAFDYGAFGTVTVYPLGGRSVFAFGDNEYYEDLRNYEVIGNIHDNPELLN